MPDSAMDLTIQLYKCWKDGRKAWIALNGKKSGRDKWLTELTNLRENIVETENLHQKGPKSIHPRNAL